MVASEHKISEQWDEAIETGIKRMAYGLAGGAVAALVLFRTSPLGVIADGLPC